jgi:hypothetical protein
MPVGSTGRSRRAWGVSAKGMRAERVFSIWIRNWAAAGKAWTLRLIFAYYAQGVSTGAAPSHVQHLK